MTQLSDVVPSREENYEAKQGERSQNTSTVMISANQLRVYGATADLCNELCKDLRAPGKPAAPDHLEKMEIPTRPSVEETQTSAQQRRNLVQEYVRELEQLSEDQKLSKLCSDAGLKLVETGQILLYS